MATNKFAGKYKEGLFSNGQGPVKGQSISREKETKSQFGGEGQEEYEKTIGGSKDYVLSGAPSDKNFDLRGSSYKGPENWAPKDEGTANPGDIKES